MNNAAAEKDRISPAIAKAVNHLREKSPRANLAYERQVAIIQVAKMVRQLRESAGLTQQQLADRLGTQQAAISRLESSENDSLPTLTTMLEIAHACNRQLVVGSRESEQAAVSQNFMYTM